MNINRITCGDCLDVMREMPDNCIDSVITDPPYGLAFMGKKWDYDVPSVEIWKECLRVLKPGGYLLSFAGTRTQHRMATGIEDAGFEIRDMIAWIYGSGFPKSLNIGKAVDKLQGNEREVIEKEHKKAFGYEDRPWKHEPDANINIVTKGTSEYEGWGSNLKPALEPITVARKPLSEKTVAENCLRWGTGGINIDGCRITHNESIKTMKAQNGGNNIYRQSGRYENTTELKESGRFPANLIHDGSDEVVKLFPESESSENIRYNKPSENNSMSGANFGHISYGHNDSGSAARFFYCAKASQEERCEGNNHPTVKPIDLMRYLCRLVTPKKGIVLDPFAGSGTTLIAAYLEFFKYIGIEKEKKNCEIARERLKIEQMQTRLNI